MENYKFEGNKYVTKCIYEELPAVLVMYLWDLIEDRKRSSPKISMDYLQIFDLRYEIINGENTLVIIHSQEQPPYREAHYLRYNKNITCKIFVIDSIDYTTMLLSHEY